MNHKANITTFRKGNKINNTGRTRFKKGVENVAKREEVRKKISLSRIGKKRKPFSKECRIKMSLSHMGKKGDKATAWRGGLTEKNQIIRSSTEYDFWRKECLKRDNFICQKSGKAGGDLQVHHINNFADFPELRFEVENGITLSKDQHEIFHKIYGKKNNTLEQLKDLLR